METAGITPIPFPQSWWECPLTILQMERPMKAIVFTSPIIPAILVLIAALGGFYLVDQFFSYLPEWPLWVYLPIYVVIIAITSWLTAPIRTGKVLKNLFKPFVVLYIETVVILVDVAKVSFKNIKAIKNSLPSIQNEFLRNGLHLAVHEVEDSIIEETMQSEIDSRKIGAELEIKELRWLLFRFLAAGVYFAGAILIASQGQSWPQAGLVFFSSLISVAFFLLPVTASVKKYHFSAQQLDQIVKKGVLMISEGTHAELVEQILLNHLPEEPKLLYLRLKYERMKEGKVCQPEPKEAA